MIRFENVSFLYGSATEGGAGVRGIDLEIPKGECVVLCGVSGCGKTTLTRLINGLIPHYYEGVLSGCVLVDGRNASAEPLYDTAAIVGSVFQNPRSQFFNVDTTSEVTFGPENLGWPEERIRERLAKTVQDFHLEALMDRSIFALSGGQKQRIACAGAAMMDPAVFVLDEPSANLDARSTEALRIVLAQWKAQGKTIVISEHRLYYLRGIADRYVYLEDGRVIHDWTATEFAALLETERTALGLRAYDLAQLASPPSAFAPAEQIVLEDFHFAYPRKGTRKEGTERLDIDRATLPGGRICGIIGDNGAGKSTFARCFCGLEKRCGVVTWRNERLTAKDRLHRAYMVMQETGHQLFTESVMEEVLLSMDAPDKAQAEEILAGLDLLALAERHPQSLSGGQKQRVAIASALASGRELLVFDEPTSGLDLRHMREVAEMLRSLCARGVSVFVITHDIELICACCTDIVEIAGGKIYAQYGLDAEDAARVSDYFLGGRKKKSTPDA